LRWPIPVANLASTVLLALPLLAVDTSRGAESPTLGTSKVFQSNKGDCFVLLRRKWPDVQSGNYPVCRAVLASLNGTCDQAPPYRRFPLHARSAELSVPDWKLLPADKEQELVREVYLAKFHPRYREERWQSEGPAVLEAVKSGTVTLWRASIVPPANDKLGGALQDVYLLNDEAADAQLLLGQARIMFADRGERKASPLFDGVARAAPSSVLIFQSAFFTFRFVPSNKRFLVGELTRPIPSGDIGNTTVCSFQHVRDQR
jgi:hypothetical protein